MTMSASASGVGFATSWLAAIDDATECLRRRQSNTTNNSNDDNNMLEAMRESIQYLESLQAILHNIPTSAWNMEPREPPPSRHRDFVPQTSGGQHGKNDIDDDDDDDDDEAGDQPMLFLTTYEPMNVLRILIRIGTYIADLYAQQGSFMAQQYHAWTEGAQALCVSLVQMRTSLELADDQISKYFQQEEEQQQPQATRNQNSRKQGLQEDADIVHVAAQSLLFQRERYLQTAKRQIAKLNRILQPQWKQRDKVKQRLGKDRWQNNPNPKNDYSQLREESEHELEQLKAAMQTLEEIDTLQDSAQILKNRLASPGGRRSGGKRYNGVRPPANANRLLGYPDPSEYLWNFTGSDHHAEFYERTFDFNDDANHGSRPTLVKLDFYFTTGTIKTSMDHPTQGKTQLFVSARDQPCTVELFTEILLNPRSHTNIRYQRRNNGRRRNR